MKTAQMDTADVSVQNLEPGQQTVQTGQFTTTQKLPADAKVVLQSVDRSTRELIEQESCRGRGLIVALPVAVVHLARRPPREITLPAQSLIRQLDTLAVRGTSARGMQARHP